MKWRTGESLKCQGPKAAFGEGSWSKERCLPEEMANCQEWGEWLRMGLLQVKGRLSWPRWDCLCVPVCPLPWHNDPGAVLSIPLLPHPPERAWASSSTTAPLLQGRSPTQLSPRTGAERQEKEKVEKKRKGAIKIIFASLPVVMQSLIFTNEGKQPQHMSKYLNLPPCFPCALKK